ncbi:MAG: metallophosphoesterase [Akkermansia sp.]|nr:metallophosphoesterase [Akkermansia sp.]
MFIISTLLIGVVLFAYTLWRLILPLPLRWWWKFLLCVPLGLGAFRYPLLYAIYGGHFFRPACPIWLELLGSWLFISLLILLGLLVVMEVALLPLRLLQRRWSLFGRFRRALLTFCAPAALGLGAWGVYQAFLPPEVREITIPLPRLEHPVRLAMLTDLHADRFKQAEFFHEVVKRTNELQADLVVITGDFEDGHVYALAPALAPLRHLEARWGIYAVDGNHDYFSGHDAWQRYLSKLGIRFLNNEHVLPGPGHLVLAGVTDPAAIRDDCPPPDIARALAGRPAGKPTVLLAHQPRLAREAARHGVQLQLSGHTHGGQAPGLRHLIAAFNDGLVQGLTMYHGLQVYISNGTSLWSGFPLRLFTPAEITHIHLIPATQAD